MTREERNKEVVRRAVAAFNARDYEALWACFTEDATSLEAGHAEPLPRERFAAFLEQFFAEFPDARVDTRALVAEGDTVIAENAVSGTSAATGRSYAAAEAVVFELRDGRICAERIYLDRKSIDEQLASE